MDQSSEQERRTAWPRHKSSKKADNRIDREETLVIDPASLPEDAAFKGYSDGMVQDIRLGTDNVLFRQDAAELPGRTFARIQRAV